MIKLLWEKLSGFQIPQHAPTIFKLLIFLLVLLSIPISVYLVKQQQDIRSRAEGTPVVFGNSRVSPSTLNFGSLSKSSPKVVKTLTVENLVSTPSASLSSSEATPPATPSSQITFIDAKVGCNTREGLTPDQICKQKGYLGTPQTTPDYGSTVAQGFWWKQCGGATLTTCTKLDCNIAQLDCTNTPGEWGTQQPYPQNYLKVGQAQTLYKPDELGLDCTNYNPGWTMRVACISTASTTPSPTPTPTPLPSSTTPLPTQIPSNYSLKLKEQIDGVSISFSEEAFSLKPGEQKILTITLEINPETLKEGSYKNEIILTIDNTPYTIPLNFEYTPPLVDKLKEAIGGKPEGKPKEEQEGQTSKFKGYIVELKNDPIVEYKKKTEAEGKITMLGDYANILSQEHEDAKKDILSRLGKNQEEVSAKEESGGGPSIVLREYTTVFNGMALDISDEEAKKIKEESPYVKDVYPNYEVKAFLNKSVPLIDADQVWDQIRDNLGRPVRGEGVKVAVIDTGVDYTHPDLGETVLPEPPYQQISVLSEYSPWSLSFDRKKQKLAYSGGTKIYIYSFDTDQQSVINTLGNVYAGRIALNERYLVYYGYRIDGRGPEYSTSALYLYEFGTGAHRKIVDANGVGSIYIRDDGKIMYGRLAIAGLLPEGFFPGPYVYVYDPQTGIESSVNAPVFSESGESLMFRISGNLIAATYNPLSNRYGCPQKFVVYDLKSERSRDLFPPEVGYITDFKGRKILYAACIGSHFGIPYKYYLYDIDTGEASIIPYGSSSSIVMQKLDNQRLGALVDQGQGEPSAQGVFWTWFSLMQWGRIGDSVVYFNKSWKLFSYDAQKNRAVRINLTKVPYRFEASEDKICFPIRNVIYCHTYDPRYPYNPPSSIFNSKVIGGYNFLENDTNPFDDHGHGTHVAATIAGEGSLNGVAPGAKLIIYKVLNSGGSGLFSDVIATIEKAVKTRLDTDLTNDIDVISMSLGTNCPVVNKSCGPDDPPSRAVDEAVGAGVIVVIAAGNSGSASQTIGSPGTARRAVTVGAVDKNKHIADFSSRGPVIIGRETIIKPDVVAPGVSICAAKASALFWDDQCVDNAHIALSGTSMAAPHVSGVAALLKQRYPSWSPDKIKAELKIKARDLGYDPNTQGTGLVNALAAVSAPSIPRPPDTLSFPLSLKLPGIGNTGSENRNPQRGDRVTTVKVLDSGRSQVSTASATLRFDGNNYVGNMDLGNLSSGSYYLTAKVDNSLSKLLNNGQPLNISPGTPIATQSATLVMGDVNNDNVINISDFTRLRQCFASRTSSSNWSECQITDFNDDGRISVTDYSRLTTNFNQRGE